MWTAYKLELLRDWVRSEIEFALAGREVGADGYGRSCVKERQVMDEAFDKLITALSSQKHDV